MDHYGPRIATTTPRTLEKRHEVMEALRALAAQEDGQIRQRQADVAALRRDLELLRDALPGLIRQSIDEARRECGALLRSYLQKYSPDQPRVPAGNPDGGEWTDGEGGDVSIKPSSDIGATPERGSEPGPQYAEHDTGTRTDAVGPEAEYEVATGTGRSGYPVDLSEDELLGGHTIAQHVGKSRNYLLSLINDEETVAQRHGDLAQGLREGSFPSLEAANKLVNATIDRNEGRVDLVVKGSLPSVELDADFPSPTGYEAFAKTERSTPYIRETYGVHVVIVRDRNSSKGYLVFTAYPVNR